MRRRPQLEQHVCALPGEIEGARHQAQQRAGLGKARSLRQFRDRDDFGAGARQLQRDLQVERAVAANHDATAGQHAVGLEQGLGRARGHDAGQRPSRDRHAALVGARRDDQPAWPEQQRLRWRRDADRQRREGAPRLGAGDDLDAGPARPIDARAPFGNLAVGRDGGGEAMGFSRLLEELSAGSGAFVDQHDAEPRLGRHRRRRQAARAAADHQQVGRAHGEVRRQDRRLAGCLLRQANGEALPANRVRSRHLGHAGALALPAVDAHEAVVADAHAAEQSAPLTARGLAQLSDAGGPQRRRQRVAHPGRHRPSFDVESHFHGWLVRKFNM